MTDFENVEPPRDRWGRYLITPPDGGKAVPMTRATTIASAVDDTTGLQKWMKRQVALGMGQRPDLVAAAATTDADDKQKLLAIAEDAMDAAGSSAAATVGTALHRATELADLGQPVPEMFTERVAEYRRVLEAAGIEVCTDAVEQVHVLWEHKVAGMADRHVIVGGRRYIFDLKTGATMAHSNGFAIQLSIYANADYLFVPATGALVNMPDVDRERAIICHLPAAGGPCVLYWIDIAAGWEAFTQALWVREWRKRKDLLSDLRPTAELIADAFPGTVVDDAETAQMLADRQQLVRDLLPPVDDAFKHRWKTELPTVAGPKKCHEWTHGDMDAIERVFGLSFTDPPAPPAVAEVINLTPVARPEPEDHGHLVEPEALSALRERGRRLPKGARTWLDLWSAQGIEAGHAWRMGRGQHVPERTYLTSLAGYWLAVLTHDNAGEEEPDEDARRVLASVLGDVALMPTITVGGCLGALTLAEAAHAAALAQAAAEGDVRLRTDGLLEVAA